MDAREQQSILTIALLAAFADGEKADHEREAIRRMAESLGHEPGGTGLAGIYQDVLLKRVTMADAASHLKDLGQRQLAYEMAVCVCDADGRQNAAEATFLAQLRQALALDPGQASELGRQPDAVADAVSASSPAQTVVPVAAVSAVSTPDMSSARAALDAELDKSILNHALLTGALELLPQSWASMAIIPLQIKMVYGIGKAHGVELDQGHIREFIAAAGVGITSQYLEQFGRKLIGGLLGKSLGRTAGGIGRTATGMAMSFATTYALGQVAKRYYAGGRVMSTEVLRQSFQELLGPARQMQERYLPQMQQQAAGLDAAKVMDLVRGR